MSKRSAAVVCEGSVAEVKAMLPLSASEALLEQETHIRKAGGRGLVLLAATERKPGDEDTAAICEYLVRGLKLEVDQNEGKSQKPPLFYATKAGHLEGVCLLLDMKADPECVDENGQTPLFYAAGAANSGAVSALVAAGASTSRRDNFGQTALFYAASSGDCADLISLIQGPAFAAVADGGSGTEGPPRAPQPRDASGRTPLFVAAQLGRHRACRTLLACLGGVDDVDCFGQSPLFFAAAGGFGKCIEALLHSGASVDLKDHSGQTPLFHAASRRHLNACKLLVQGGADPWMEDAHGLTALDIVLSRRARFRKQNRTESSIRTTEILVFFQHLPGCPEVPENPHSLEKLSASIARQQGRAQQPCPAARRPQQGSKRRRQASPDQVEKEEACPSARCAQAAKRRQAAAPREVVLLLPAVQEEGHGDDEAEGPVSRRRAQPTRGRASAAAQEGSRAARPVARRLPASRRGGAPQRHGRGGREVAGRPQRGRHQAEEEEEPGVGDREHPSLEAWLDSYSLSEYAEGLVAAGYEDVCSLVSIGVEALDAALDAAGVAKAGHRTKFRCALRVLCRRG